MRITMNLAPILIGWSAGSRERTAGYPGANAEHWHCVIADVTRVVPRSR